LSAVVTPSAAPPSALRAHKPVTMGRLALRNVRAKPSRFIATMLAVLIGTAFLSGALVLNDSLSSSLESNAVKQVAHVDAAVEPNQAELGGGGRRGGRRGGNQVASGVPMDLLATVQKVDGVAGAAGVSTGRVEIVGADGKVARSGALGHLWIPVAQLNPFTLTSGSAPSKAGEIAVDEATAAQLALSLGQHVSLRTTSGAASATVVGITHFGDDAAANISGGDIFVAQADAADFLTEGVEQYSAIYIAAAPEYSGAHISDLVAKVQRTVGSEYEAVSGDDVRTQAAGDTAGLVNVIGVGLRIFAFIALFVCVFIIYNTFSIIVAQRVREFALLRAIGADTKQIARALRREALIIGVGTSIAGWIAGIGLFLVLLRVVPAFKDLTGGGSIRLRLGVVSAAVVILLGTFITLASAIIPSWRAGRIKPIAALQSSAIDRSGTSRWRAIGGPVLLAVGAALFVLGVSIGSFWLALPGPVLLFLGVLIGGPVLARLFATLAGFIVRPLARRVGGIAIENVQRNPGRAATTANALVIGVFLVVFVTAAGGAVRDYAAAQLSQFNGPDLTVVGATTVPAELASQIAAVPGVTSTAQVYSQVGMVQTAAGPSPIGATDYARFDTVGIKASTGNLATLRDDQFVVWDLVAAQYGLDMGSSVTVTMSNGKAVTGTVGALVSPVLTLAPVLMSNTAAKAADPDLQPQQLAVQAQPGEATAVQHSIEALTEPYTSVAVLPGNIFGVLIKAIFTGLIESVNALLGVAVVIALFGIVNTLILSVTERTREIGVLRAVGMTRGQLRSTIRIEALVVALLGTLVGLAFGLFVAYMVTRPIFQDGSGSFAWPVQELVLVALLGVVIGIVASLVPAWRASRLDVLEAVESE
jgi:putative ABC transport system permease protein